MVWPPFPHDSDLKNTRGPGGSEPASRPEPKRKPCREKKLHLAQLQPQHLKDLEKMEEWPNIQATVCVKLAKHDRKVTRKHKDLQQVLILVHAIKKMV